jgi:hypothetical protein
VFEPSFEGAQVRSRTVFSVFLCSLSGRCSISAGRSRGTRPLPTVAVEGGRRSNVDVSDDVARLPILRLADPVSSRRSGGFLKASISQGPRGPLPAAVRRRRQQLRGWWKASVWPGSGGGPVGGARCPKRWLTAVRMLAAQVCIRSGVRKKKQGQRCDRQTEVRAGESDVVVYVGSDVRGHGADEEADAASGGEDGY